MADHLHIELDAAGALRIQLDKPERRNALDDDMVDALIDAVDVAGRDEAVRVIVVSGAGEHFCSGFDIVGRNATDPEAKRPRVGSIQRRLPSQSHRLVSVLTSVQVPIVCRVQGWCAGIGLHVALAADFAIAADDAQLWEPFTQRGFTPDSGGTWLLPRRIGDVRAREMLLLGKVVGGAEAAEWGMVHRSVPLADLDAEVDAVVTACAAAPTVAVGLTKWLLSVSPTTPFDEQLRNEAFAMELSSRSDDFREGLAAFKEKRPPRFSGR